MVTCKSHLLPIFNSEIDKIGGDYAHISACLWAICEAVKPFLVFFKWPHRLQANNSAVTRNVISISTLNPCCTV